MWYKAQGMEMPSTIDETSSQVYVYVRKNINAEQRTNENGDAETIYVWDEAKIPKEIFDIFKAQTDSEVRIADIEDTLADMLFGGDK